MHIKGYDAWRTAEPDYPEWCEVCGLDPGWCVCPECPVCGTFGDPLCYREHGLELSHHQRVCLEYMALCELLDREADNRYAEELEKERKAAEMAEFHEKYDKSIAARIAEDMDFRMGRRNR